MTQPDDWTQDHTDALGDVAWDKIIAERDAAIAERAHYGDTMSAKLGQCENERDALRAALQSLVDGKSEFDIEYDTGMPADEARKIMDLAYNRK